VGVKEGRGEVVLAKGVAERRRPGELELTGVNGGGGRRSARARGMGAYLRG